jgi:hypothetical protein
MEKTECSLEAGALAAHHLLRMKETRDILMNSYFTSILAYIS